jgi:hypothetical protein
MVPFKMVACQTTVMDCLRRLPDALALRDLLSRSGVHPPDANRLDFYTLQ